MALDTSQAAQRAAHSILTEGRFHNPSVPDPLHGALVWLGNAATDPLNAIGKLVDRIGDDFPGGVAGAWVAGAVLLALAVGLIARRRAKTRLQQRLVVNQVARQRPAELERAAERAEREGRWQEAVRLRFQAGLLRLNERDGGSYTQTTPNHSLARLLGSEQLEQVSRRFDEIVYGGDAANAEDAEGQRRAWTKILAGDKR